MELDPLQIASQRAFNGWFSGERLPEAVGLG